MRTMMATMKTKCYISFNFSGNVEADASEFQQNPREILLGNKKLKHRNF